MELSKREKRKLKLGGKVQDEVGLKVEHTHHEHKKPVSKLKIIGISIIALIVLIAVYGLYSFSKPGPLDNFAKCLTEKGAVMYGLMASCKYTQGQKGMFGNSFKYINYHEYTELPGIKKTPTWVINGQRYENAQSIDRLSEITGCKING